ncbi:MAG: hypothetical protein ACI90V_007054, partial [Bacillariaceae sp.]
FDFDCILNKSNVLIFFISFLFYPTFFQRLPTKKQLELEISLEWLVYHWELLLQLQIWH